MDIKTQEFVTELETHLEKTTSLLITNYRSSSSGSIGSYTINLDMDYGDLVESDIDYLKGFEVDTELANFFLEEHTDKVETLENAHKLLDDALSTLIKSKTKPKPTPTLDATKPKGGEVYTEVCKGIKVHNKNQTVHVMGILESIDIKERGNKKPVNSRATTLAKNIITRDLPTSKIINLKISVDSTLNCDNNQIVVNQPQQN